MECKTIREKLSAYLDGAVTLEERRLIEQHLSSCQPCSTALEDLKKTAVLVKRLEDVEPPPWLTQKVMSRVRTEGEAKRSLFQKLFYPLHVKIPIEAFATVLAAVMVIYIFKAVEPEMKRIHPSLAPEQVISTNEAPKKSSVPGGEPRPDSQARADKTISKGFNLSDKGEPARGEGERGEGTSKEKNAVSEAKEGLPMPGAGKPLPAEPPLQSEIAQKRETAEVREQEQTGAAESPRREAVTQQQYPPAAATKQKEGMATKDVAVGGTRERKALSAAPQLTVAVTVHVKDVRSASREIENLLGQLGAYRIERQSLERGETITAGLRAEKIQELFEKLRAIGEVKEKGTPLDVLKGDAGIRIEVVSAP